MVFDDATYIGEDAGEMVVLQFDACAFDMKDKVYVNFYECTCHVFFCHPFGVLLMDCCISRGSFSAMLRKRLLRRRASLRSTPACVLVSPSGFIPPACILPPLRGFLVIYCHISRGSASLHPCLYSCQPFGLSPPSSPFYSPSSKENEEERTPSPFGEGRGGAPKYSAHPTPWSWCRLFSAPTDLHAGGNHPPRASSGSRHPRRPCSWPAGGT